MDRIRLYADEHFPDQITRWLRRKGYDVTTVKQNNQNKRGDKVPDHEVLARATREGRSVLTENRADFHALHTANRSHSGIINCRQPDELSDKAMAKLIDDAIKRAIAEYGALDGQLLTVPVAGQKGRRQVGRGGMR